MTRHRILPFRSRRGHPSWEASDPVGSPPAGTHTKTAPRGPMVTASVVVALLGVMAGSAGVLSASGAAQAASLPSDVIRHAALAEGTTRWVASTGGALSTTVGRDGTPAIRVTNTTANPLTVALNDRVNTVSNATKGKDYHVSAWVHTSNPKVDVNLRVREVSGGGLVGTTQVHQVLSGTGWHRLSMTRRAAVQGSSFDLNVLAWNLGSKRSFDVDDVTVVAGATPTPTPTPTTTPTTKPTPTPTPTPTANCAIGQKLVPTCGALWGGYTTSSGPDWATPFTGIESQLGRKFDVTKRYHDWSGTGNSGAFPDASERLLGANGDRILYFSWVSKIWSSGQTALWRDIAAGKYDETIIKPQAERLKAWKQPVFLDFDHEMDGKTRTNNGTTAEYVAAYRHIHDVVNGVGASNVVWVWMPTGFMGNADRIKAMYPGSAYVDWVGYDPYNFYTCNGSGWRSPTQTFRPFYDWLQLNGMANKPVMLGEYGSVQDPSNLKGAGDWYAGVPSAIKSMPLIKAVVHWNSRTTVPCDFRVTTASNLMQGFKVAAGDPYVNIRD